MSTSSLDRPNLGILTEPFFILDMPKLEVMVIATVGWRGRARPRCTLEVFGHVHPSYG